MPLPLMIHSALALFAQRTRIPTSARSTAALASVSFGFVLVRVRVRVRALVNATSRRSLRLLCGEYG